MPLAPIARGLGITTATILPVLLLTVGSARADDCRNSVSLIQAADGRCYDLSYLTALGRSRQNLQAASRSYNQAVNLNTPRPVVEVTQIPVTERSTTSLVTFDTYYDTPSPEEVKANRELLRRADGNLQRQAVTNEVVESWAFRRHQQVLNGVGQAAGNARPVYYDAPQGCDGCTWSNQW